MKRQRGQAFILVLILLAVGALVIVPTLRYTFTGLHSQRISEDVMATQYAADSALEDALWQMLYGTVLFSLDPEFNPADNFTLTVGHYKGIFYSIEVPSIPTIDNWVTEKENWVWVGVDPNWLEGQVTENTTFTYTICINSPNLDVLIDFGLVLPLDFSYSENSTMYFGPDSVLKSLKPWDEADPLWDQVVWLDKDIPLDDIEWPAGLNPEEDGQRLTWDPVFVKGGRRIFILTFQATGNPGWGVHYTESSFSFWEGSGDPLPTVGIGVAIYNIIIEVEGLTYQVVVAYDNKGTPDSSDDEMEIISYQIVE